MEKILCHDTHRSTTNSYPDRLTIERRLSSSSMPLNQDESLKMLTENVSVYKVFAFSKLRVTTKISQKQV
ncbi:hypothetical protein MNBD_PLANCTO02-87 [hydrothermal vent metagenome]|uniref:Uncharacterized protein n=2 Tax=hydrothermal vent metagenome TaxID=652676 RepID=A0A3B1DP67_9ZZZZ